MDAGVPQYSFSDGTTIIVFGPGGQMQMGSGTGRADDSTSTPSVPDPVPPDRDQPTDRDQQSDAPNDSNIPTPIVSVTLESTPTDTTSPVLITNTSAFESTAGTLDRSSLTPMATVSAMSRSDALSSASSSSFKGQPSSGSFASSSLRAAGSSTRPASSVQSTSQSSALTSRSSSAMASSASSTGNPSSTSHSQTTSSSILSSSSTAPRVSASVASRPLNSSSQTLNAHTPSYYVAVSLGSIAGAAVAIALIAWIIRLLTKASRRRKARHTTVPWGDPGSDKENQFGVTHIGYDDNLSSIPGTTFGNDNMAYPRRWSYRGDCGVRDPQHVRLDASGNPLRDHPIIPGCTLPADCVFDEVDLGPYVRPSPNLRVLPSHLVDEDLAARARLESCPVHSDLPGPPVSLRAGVYAERGPSPVALNADSRDLAPGLETTEALQKRSGQEEKTDEHSKDNAEAWASSLKHSLVNAFNAVAVNINGAPRMGDKLDASSRRGTRSSVRDVQWDSKRSDLKRGVSVSSKPWTLEETREGAGIVHLHIDDPREYRAQKPHATITPSDTRVTQPRRYLHGGLSRESSIYSTLSAYPEWRERPSRQGSINPSVRSARKFRSLRVTNLTHESRQSSMDSVVIQPNPISRLPSTASSATQIQDVRRPEIDTAASRALRERQKKALQMSSS